jgi:HD superfamily phosphodiesterase
MSFLNKLFHFVLLITSKYDIDESHGISHSMNVLNHAENMYRNEIINNPAIRSQDRVIYVSAILHDMCDKKYMNESEGVNNISEFLRDTEQLNVAEIDAISKIISTMSYSKVKKNGFPDLGEYQTAYHIVREADLLTAYDFDRSMIYNMIMVDKEGGIDVAYNNAVELFEKRVLRHNEDGLFFTEYGKQQSMILHQEALRRMNTWTRIKSRIR